MTGDQKIWVDHAKWSESWTCIETLPGGGQGHARRARRKLDGQVAFLKVVKAEGNSERRVRFFREASAYNTIRAHGIPRLIESNALSWEDAEVEPYIATEFIEGPTLRRWREAQPGVEVSIAIQTTRELLTTLGACHAGGVVHRDVKPDNIILAGSDPGRPVLLDFGLSFHEVDGLSFATEQGQEVGNRFLRLPELSAGSPLKQDPRSDLSFVAGVLFYVLTSRNPNVLLDAEGHLPHQRPDNLAKIRQVAGPGLTRLLSLFDTAFSPQIAHRFTDADVMSEKLEGVMKPRVTGRSEEDLLKDIRETVDTQAARRRADTHARLGEALNHIQRVHEDARKSLGFTVNRTQSNWNISETLGRNTLGWVKPGSDEALLSVKCEVREAGDEIVISLSGAPVYRTSIDTPLYDDSFDEKLRFWLIDRLHDTVINPDSLPPEADNFQEHRPFGSLEDAKAEAHRTGRNILAFVYDPTQEQRGRLQHCLGYFLENRKTLDTINSAFVLALVQLPQIAAVTSILNNESMERSRWIVFDLDLEPLEQAVIRANPQDGERIAHELANRFGP